MADFYMESLGAGSDRGLRIQRDPKEEVPVGAHTPAAIPPRSAGDLGMPSALIKEAVHVICVLAGKMRVTSKSAIQVGAEQTSGDILKPPKSRDGKPTARINDRSMLLKDLWRLGGGPSAEPLGSADDVAGAASRESGRGL